MVFRPFFLVVLFACSIRYVSAQVDTTVVVEELLIQASSLRQQTVGSQKQQWRSKELENLPTAMPELLQSEAGIYIKGYGLGSLSTSSVRGGSAGHTLVLWNGLPLQSPLLGLLDLSLLPVQSFEEIGLEKGGQSALWGSGAIGGVLSLNNQQSQEGVSGTLQLGLGSFGSRKQGASVGFDLGRFYLQSKLNHETADNDFTYSLGNGAMQRQQSNAQIATLNIHQDVYVKLNQYNHLAVHYWYQNVEREIPPTTVQTASEAYQEDKANRILIDWKRLMDNSRFNLKVGTVIEELNYFDPSINLSSPSRFHKYFAEVSHELELHAQGQLSVGLTHNYTKATATGYQDDISENKTAVFSSYQWRSSLFTLQGSVRQEIVDGQTVPFIPAIGFAVSMTDKWEGRGKLSRNYRLPTLNDRFWRPGGNAALRAESGWSQELSLHFSSDSDASKWAGTVTGFSRQIDDWILWALLDGQTFFSANNISKVWSRGLEARLAYNKTFSKWSYALKGGYDFIKSTNETPIEQPKLEKGEQLIYTPKHQGFFSVSIHWQSFMMRYSHQAVGSVSGINEDINAYHIGNIRLQTNIKVLKNKSVALLGDVYISIQNLWNTNYRVIERRAMPGRYFTAGIKLKLNTKR